MTVAPTWAFFRPFPATARAFTPAPANGGYPERTDAEHETSAARPPMDLFETANALVLRAWMPGVAPEAIDIRFEQGVLVVEGAIVPEGESAEVTRWHVRGLPARTWKLSFETSLDLDATHAEATYEHGVLTLRLPKAEAALPRTIRVNAA